MKSNFVPQSWLDQYLVFHCEDCGSDAGYRSRAQTFSERYLLPAFLLQPVRCAECFRRDYRLIFMPVVDRAKDRTEDRTQDQIKDRAESPGPKPVEPTSVDHRNAA